MPGEEDKKSVHFADDVYDPPIRPYKARDIKARSSKAFSEIEVDWYHGVKARLEQNLHHALLAELPASEVQRSKILTVCNNAPFRWFASIGDIRNMRFLIEHTTIRSRIILAPAVNNYEAVAKFIAHCVKSDLTTPATQRLLKSGWAIFTSLDEGLSVGDIHRILSAHDPLDPAAVSAVLATLTDPIPLSGNGSEPIAVPAIVSADEDVFAASNFYDAAVKFACDVSQKIEEKLSLTATLIYQILDAILPEAQTEENERQLDLLLVLMGDLNSLGASALPIAFPPHAPSDPHGDGDGSSGMEADHDAFTLPITGQSSNSTEDTLYQEAAA